MSAFSHAQLTIVGCACVFIFFVVSLLSSRSVRSHAIVTSRSALYSPPAASPPSPHSARSTRRRISLTRRADSDKWLWEEAALGTGGENICFDPLGLHTRAMVTDVRVKLFDGAWKVHRPPRPRKARLVRSPLHSNTLRSLAPSHFACWLRSMSRSAEGQRRRRRLPDLLGLGGIAAVSEGPRPADPLERAVPLERVVRLRDGRRRAPQRGDHITHCII